jgi:hypothetical protein
MQPSELVHLPRRGFTLLSTPLYSADCVDAYGRPPLPKEGWPPEAALVSRPPPDNPVVSAVCQQKSRNVANEVHSFSARLALHLAMSNHGEPRIAFRVPSDSTSWGSLVRAQYRPFALAADAGNRIPPRVTCDTDALQARMVLSPVLSRISPAGATGASVLRDDRQHSVGAFLGRSAGRVRASRPPVGCTNTILLRVPGFHKR